MLSEGHIFRKSVYRTFYFVSLIWFIKLVEWSTYSDFGFLGIYPRKLLGAVGILTGPLVHGDFFHLLSNTFPLVLLGVGIYYFYHRIALEIFIWIYLMTGVWVWAAARDAFHIGSSGLVYGMVSFLFFSGIFRKNKRPLAISLVVLFLHHGMLAGIFPGDAGVSWESHVFGAIAGLFCAFHFRKFKMRFENKTSLPENNVPTNANLSVEEFNKIQYSIVPGVSSMESSDQIDSSPKASYSYRMNKPDVI